jgi:cytidylate kinase
MIITIDGPAGAGKSTVARKLAARLELPYLDTGAMYRAIALAAMRAGVDLADSAALIELARRTRLEVDCGPTHSRVRIDGHDVSEAIRTMAVNQATPYVAGVQAIRDLLVAKQREIGRQLGAFVTEGRDQGSVVFPDADVKFVLEGSPQKRAQRRHQEMLAEGEEIDYETVLHNLVVRDANDSKQWAALMAPGAAIRIDTSRMGIAEVVDRLSAHIHQLTGWKPGT